MKECPACHASYPAGFSHCPREGAVLVDRDPWAPGSVIREKYRILGEAGKGAMAVVYKAEHIQFRELRALKVISESLAGDESFVRRFTQEALVARRLQHPNVVRIDDIETAEDGRPFIVMEFIEGSDLRSVIQQGPMELARVLSITSQVTSALAAAHRLGMIHRDIKPANILLAGEVAKVADFGIAKVNESNRGDGYASLTEVGGIVGSPAYMSPEQALGKRGEELDARSDIYSLGVVMFQALTGRLPVSADSSTAYLSAQVHSPPTAIQSILPEIPVPVAALVMQCLEKDRDLRPASAEAVLAALNLPAPKEDKVPRPSPMVPELIAAVSRFAVLAATEWLTRRSGMELSPWPWAVAGFGLGAVDIWRLRSGKVFGGWLMAAALAALLNYLAASRISSIWLYFANSAILSDETIRWGITAVCVLLCLLIGSLATNRSYLATACAVTVFVLLAVAVTQLPHREYGVAAAGAIALFAGRLLDARREPL